MALYKQ
jgi:hypothetical protein